MDARCADDANPLRRLCSRVGVLVAALLYIQRSCLCRPVLVPAGTRLACGRQPASGRSSRGAAVEAHDAPRAPQVPNIISLDLREGDRRWDALMSKEPYAYTVRLRLVARGRRHVHALCLCA